MAIFNPNFPPQDPSHRMINHGELLHPRDLVVEDRDGVLVNAAQTAIDALASARTQPASDHLRGLLSAATSSVINQGFGNHSSREAVSFDPKSPK